MDVLLIDILRCIGESVSTLTPVYCIKYSRLSWRLVCYLVTPIAKRNTVASREEMSKARNFPKHYYRAKILNINIIPTIKSRLADRVFLSSAELLGDG